MDECPLHDRRCPQRDLRCSFANQSSYVRAIGMHAKTPVWKLLRTGSVRPCALALELLREHLPRGRGETQDRAAVAVLGVAYRDRGGRPAYLYAIALTACVGGCPPAGDRLVTHSSLLILVMSCAESIGDSAHPLIMLSAVAMAATSFGSLRTLPNPHPSR